MGGAVQDFQADNIERASRSLVIFLATTPENRRDWRPDSPGAASVRSALEQINECIVVNRMFASILRGDAGTVVNPRTAPSVFSHPDDAPVMLAESAAEVAELVRGMSDADLWREYTTPRGEAAGINVIEIPYRNMIYHCGQINLIQLLYGDTEYHVTAPIPPG